MQASEVLDFWFVQHGPEDWFMGGETFDDRCAENLTDIHAKAIKGELWDWRDSVEGRIAEIVLLDQLSRQLNRGKAEAFASDPMALALAQEMVRAGMDRGLSTNERLFIYLPFEHAESMAMQKESVRLFTDLGDEGYLDYAEKHLEVIEKFGRFPFRNEALGRQSTPDEIDYISEREGKGF
jgi:uncharacterized protein (DUF924 family)